MPCISLNHINNGRRARLKSIPTSWKAKAQQTLLDNPDLPYHDPLCSTCKSFGIWDHLTGRKIREPAEWVMSFITDPQDVQQPERLRCAFCRLVFDLLPVTAFAPQHQHDYARNKDAYCILRSIAVKVGRDVFTSFVVVYDFHEYISHSPMVFQNYRGEIALDSKTRRAYNVVGVSTVMAKNTADIHQIRQWLRLCDRHHDTCQHERKLTEARGSIPMLLIDVIDGCLIESDSTATYTTLSYVWGKVDFLHTTMANLNSAKTPGYLRGTESTECIPRMIQDAMTLTKRLGIQYLWVDCLCIVQDDDQSRHTQIQAMDRIYSRAYLTIIASGSQDAQTPLHGVEKDSRASFRSHTTVNFGTDHEAQDIVVTCVPIPAATYQNSVYESRAWTFQEKKLSLRHLYMTPWGVWFQCMTSRFSNAEVGELPLEDSSMSDELSQIVTNFRSSDKYSESLTSKWHDWASHVEGYSGRDLSFPSDRLDAFRGVLYKLTAITKWEFQWAHPEGRLLPLSFLFIHTDIGLSRGSANPQPGDPLNVLDFLSERNIHFPSWSWLGWSGRVSFRLLFELLWADIDPRLEIEVNVVQRNQEDWDISKMDKQMRDRFTGRGWLEVSGNFVETKNVCCRLANLQVPSFDGQTGCAAMVSDLYPYYEDGSLLKKRKNMAGSPCGVLFGNPWWNREVEGQERLFLLLKRVEGTGDRSSLRSFSEKSHPGIGRFFEEGLDEGEGFCIVMVVDVFVEGSGLMVRKALALLTVEFWDSQQVFYEKHILV